MLKLFLLIENSNIQFPELNGLCYGQKTGNALPGVVSTLCVGIATD